jgi:hypothetical protein
MSRPLPAALTARCRRFRRLFGNVSTAADCAIAERCFDDVTSARMPLRQRNARLDVTIGTDAHVPRALIVSAEAHDTAVSIAMLEMKAAALDNKRFKL